MSGSVLVTGASRGIGKHIALRLADSGFDIAVHCHRRVEAAEALCEEIRTQGVGARVLHRDAAFPAMEWQDWQSVIRTNLDGFYHVLHPVVMPMVRARRGGRIVVMSSLSGIMGNRGQVNYSAAKGGLIAAAKALSVELAKRHITVNCVAPGLIETDMTADIDVDQIFPLIPARRLGRPEEVASLVAYLFSPDAGYITRQVISVNGGMA